VRALDRDPDRPLTGALAFVAVFGLASGAYYAGRSHPEVLVTSFAAWAFALALLTLVVMRGLAARPRRWREPASLACLLAFFVTACSLAQTPAPWSQVDRLRHTTRATLGAPEWQTFIAAHTRPGERVAILQPLGHRIGANLGVQDVTPYTGILSMPTVCCARKAAGRCS
jgi:peptidoglycan/LPS O-acetylase OafA/YrhL